MTLISSGIDYPVFNATVITASAGAADFGGKLDVAARYYDRQGLGWSCWYCDESTGATRIEIARLLRKARLRRVTEHQGMIAERLLPARHSLPALDVRPVADRSSRQDFIAICTRVFGLPPWVATQIYGSEPFWGGEFRAWVGYRDGRPICIAASEADSEGVGVYSVGTIPELRGMGYGEAITRFAIALGSERAGSGRAVLQATRIGTRLYSRMGFEAAGRISVYASR